MLPLFPEPIIVLDTETTGLGRNAELIEIGAVCLDEYGREATYFSSLIQPVNMGPSINRALEITKINREMLRKAPTWEHIYPHFIRWVNDIPTHSAHPKALAFNAPFDKRILEGQGVFLNWGQCVKQYSYRRMKQQNAAPRNKNGHLKQPKLSEACAYFGVPLPKNAHRALDDTRATAKLVCVLHKTS